MIHPLIRVLATDPGLVADHLSGYAALVASETSDIKTRFIMRMVLAGTALLCVAVAAVLVGVSVMLWAASDNLSTGAQWALVLTPAVPIVAAIAAIAVARRPVAEVAFATLKAQLEADARMLKEASTA